jgi:iron complex outermembrane receptor protein
MFLAGPSAAAAQAPVEAGEPTRSAGPVVSEQPAKAAEPAERAEPAAQGELVEEADSDAAAEPAVVEDVRPVLHAGVEEILVTAERREASLQDVPIAISAFSGERLAEGGIERIDELSFNVPNFHYGTDLGRARITIRGVSTSGGDQATAFHVDGIYQNSEFFPAGMTFYDIERIEVLRGPQGTLYGRNATGGSVNVISKRPTHDFEIFGDLQVGNYSMIQGRGVVNIPLVEDSLAVRASFFGIDREGYQRNLLSDDRSADRDDRRRWGVRGQALWSPHERFEMVLRGVYGRVDEAGFGRRNEGDFPGPTTVFDGDFELVPGVFIPLKVDADPFKGAIPNPEDVREVYQDFFGGTEATNRSGNGTATWGVGMPGIGDTEFVLSAAYTRGDIEGAMDFDTSSVPAVRNESTVANEEYVADLHWATTNEGDPGWRGDLKWQLGGFYLRSSQTIDSFVPTNIALDFSLNNGPPITLALDIPFETGSSRLDQSGAIYGQMTYTLFEDFDLTGGVRYTQDWKELDHYETALIIPVDLPGLPPGLSICLQPEHEVQKSNSWGDVSGKLGAQYRFGTDHNVYFNFSPGYKAGTVNPDLPPDLTQIAGITLPGQDPICPAFTPVADAEPERLLAYEAGIKNRFWDGRLMLNLTGFYYDYENLQVSTLFGATAIVQNAATARLYGFEIESAAMLFDHLGLEANFAFLDARFSEFTGFEVEDPANDGVVFTGNTMPRAPRFSGNFVASWSQQMGRFGTLMPRAQIFASDRVFFRASNSPKDTQDAYWFLNLRLMWWSEEGNVSAEFFVNNVLDKDIQSYKDVGSYLLGAPTSTGFEPPRTIGFRLGLKY